MGINAGISVTVKAVPQPVAPALTINGGTSTVDVSPGWGITIGITGTPDAVVVVQGLPLSPLTYRLDPHGNLSGVTYSFSTQDPPGTYRVYVHDETNNLDSDTVDVVYAQVSAPHLGITSVTTPYPANPFPAYAGETIKFTINGTPGDVVGLNTNWIPTAKLSGSGEYDHTYQIPAVIYKEEQVELQAVDITTGAKSGTVTLDIRPAPTRYGGTT